ncbi:MAG: hypothetical protein KDD33_06395 [Bdellovibrionales bacterium]|nr:hypothetical protein [Bdellovibrionales bacterium]
MVSDLGLVVFEGHNYFNSEALPIRSNIYNFWKELWIKVNRELGLNNEVLSDTFNRYDVIIALVEKSTKKVIGTSFHSFFDLLDVATQQMKYIKTYSPSFFDELKSKDIRSVMSTEYLAINPEYRKGKKGILYADIIASIVTHVFQMSPADAVICAARNDVGVSKLAKVHGYLSLLDDSDFRGYHCDQMVLYRQNISKGRPLNKEDVYKEIWANRSHYFNYVTLRDFIENPRVVA